MGANSGLNKHRSFFSGRGFYIALALSLAAVGSLGYFLLFGGEDDAPAQSVVAVQPPRDAEVIPPPAVSEPVLPDADAIPLEPVIDTTAPVEIVLDLPDDPAAPAEPPRLIVPPVEGETISAFSVSELQYDPTMDDWRTHDGIDIAADEGAQVLAACSGTVLSVADDDRMGTTVILSHDGGYETCYANLAPETTVQPGVYVSAGQVIASVGHTALAESAQPSHLHFSVTKGGESIDPNAFLDR